MNFPHVPLLLLATLAALAATPAAAQPPVCAQALRAVDANRALAAIQPLTQCLELVPTPRARGVLLTARARAYGELKQWPAAAEDQRQAIALVPPTNVWPDVMLGDYLRESQRLEESLAALEEARHFDEDGPGTGPGMAVWYHTARTLHAMGRDEQAIAAIDKGLPRQAGYGYAYYQRALSYEALGDLVKAKADLVKAGELAPEKVYEPEIAKKLDEYGAACATCTR